MSTQANTLYEAQMARIRLHRDARELENKARREYWNNRINAALGEKVPSQRHQDRVQNMYRVRAEELRMEGDKVLANAYTVGATQ
ncbi:hypothetical protein HYT24_00040 [Candidatus Pacearchaeota archaeon]|nr:hypothetical protein [Candidatus Pacearchaeota archaeon]